MVVECFGTALVAKTLIGGYLLVVACSVVVFFLPVEGTAEVVLATGVGGVAFQGTAIGYLGLVVAFFVVLTVAFTELVP